MEIIFSTKTYRSRVTKRPRIETNEGPPHKYVTIIAQVVARPDSTFPVRFKPYKLDISQFGETPRTEMNFSIENVANFDVHLKMIQFPEELVIVELPDVVEAGKTAQGTLRLLDSAIDQVFDKSFTVELDDEPHSRFTIPIIRKLHNPPPAHTTTSDESDEGTSKE